MYSIRSYLERRGSGELRGMLSGYCAGVADIDTETVLLICEVLFLRTQDKPDLREEFRRLCRKYIE